MRLFCFPYAGGAAHLFHGWSNMLPQDVEVCAVNLPGRAQRMQERPYRRLARLVDDACEGLRPDLDRPFALFGHSMGALIAFEAARCLRAKYGAQPVHLFVSGRRPPQLSNSTSQIHNLADNEFLDELKRMGGAPTEIFGYSDVMELMAPVIRADFEMVETYLYYEGEKLSCPITALGGMDDPDIPPDCLEQWGIHTTANFSMHWFPGDHFFIHSARRFVLGCLAAELNFLRKA